MTRYYSNTSSRVVIPKLGYVYPQGYEPGNIEVHAESCPPGLAQDRLHAELSLPEFSVLLPVSQGCHPGIGCRERVKGLEAVTESFLVGQLKPGLSLALELAVGT